MRRLCQGFTAVVAAVVLVGCNEAPPPAPAQYSGPNMDQMMRQRMGSSGGRQPGRGPGGNAPAPGATGNAPAPGATGNAPAPR